MRERRTDTRQAGDGSPGLERPRGRRLPGRRGTARALAGVTGLAFLVMGARRRDRMGVLLGSVGAGLLVGGLTGHAPNPRAMLPRLGHLGGVPADRVFEFWSPYEDTHEGGGSARSARSSASQVPPFPDPPPYSKDSVHAH